MKSATVPSRNLTSARNVILDRRKQSAGIESKPMTEFNQSTPAMRSKGVGDHLKGVTAELGLTMKEGCNCKALAAEMNRLGPEGCRRDRARLVEALKKNAQKYTWGDVVKAAAKALTTGLAWRIDLTDPYGALLDEAIRRASCDNCC